MITLRPYQAEIVSKAYGAWSRVPNILAVLPTGGGKTFTLSYIVNDCVLAGKRAIIFAHRDHLCEQLSLSLAAMEITHGFLTSNATRTHITNMHYEKYRRSFFDDSAEPQVIVASVATFAAKAKKQTLPGYVNGIQLVVIDEAHHVLRENIWGRCLDEIPSSAHVLGVTATPERTDKKGLGRHNDGVFDELVEGVNMRWLIDNGMLSPYRVIAPPGAQAVREEAKKMRVTASGDFSSKVAESLVDTKHITGDVVQTYLRFAAGKQGITFCASVEHAEKLAQAYREAGVTAEAVSSYTKPNERKRIVNLFRKGKIDQLTNYQLFDEGFDVPGVVVVSFVRPTMSYGLYVQMFGRALRILAGKKNAIIIDHVDNVREHRLPDYGKEWTLDAPKKRENNTQSEYSLKKCGNPTGAEDGGPCFTEYELPASECPACGWRPMPAETREYQEVDGELVELTREDIEALQRDRNKIDLSPDQFEQWAINAAPSRVAAFAMVKNHKKVQDAQADLRNTLHNWWVKNDVPNDSYGREQFSQIFKMSVGQAMTLKTKDAQALQQRVEKLLYGTNSK